MTEAVQLSIQSFQRKPFAVRGARVTEVNIEEVAKWCNGTVEREGSRRYVKVRILNPGNPSEAQFGKAFVGHWILVGAGKNYKVYSDKSLRMTFDDAPEAPPAGNVFSTVSGGPRVVGGGGGGGKNPGGTH